jgi:hypothetical protein
MKKMVYGFLVLSSFGFGLLGADDPFVGTWKLNVAQSKFVKGREVKESTVNIVRQGDIATATVNGTDGAGKAISVKYTVPAAGGAENFTEGGPPAGTTVVMTKVNDKAADFTSTMNGKPVGTSHAVVSANGMTLTVTQKGVDEKGKAYTTLSVYNRQ